MIKYPVVLNTYILTRKQSTKHMAPGCPWRVAPEVLEIFQLYYCEPNKQKGDKNSWRDIYANIHQYSTAHRATSWLLAARFLLLLWFFVQIAKRIPDRISLLTTSLLTGCNIKWLIKIWIAVQKGLFVRAVHFARFSNILLRKKPLTSNFQIL